MSTGGAQHAKIGAARFALSMMKRPKFQDGGPVVGPLLGTDGGRSDTLPINVPEGSYVIPSDIVSGLPGAQSNSLAGHVALNKLFSSLPLSPDEAPYGVTSPNLAHGKTMPGLSNQHHLMQASLAKGGKAESKTGDGTVPILAAAGEYVVSPVYVRRLGLGSLERGHAILDRFVKETRKKHIDTLKKLPGPVTN